MADLTRFLLDLPPPPRRDDAWQQALSQFVTRQFTQLYAVLAGGLRWQNLRCNLLTVTLDVSGTNTVSHTLGKVPEFILVVLPADGRWWADSTDKAAWSTTQVQFKTSLASGSAILLVM